MSIYVMCTKNKYSSIVGFVVRAVISSMGGEDGGGRGEEIIYTITGGVAMATPI